MDGADKGAFAEWWAGGVASLRTHKAGSRGTLVGDARGQRPLARRRPSRRKMSEGARVQTRTRCRMPPHQSAGIAKPAVWFEGVLNGATTKRTSVVYHGSSQECLRRQGGVAPLTPGCRRTLGLSYGRRLGKDAIPPPSTRCIHQNRPICRHGRQSALPCRRLTKLAEQYQRRWLLICVDLCPSVAQFVLATDEHRCTRIGVTTRPVPVGSPDSLAP